MRSASNAPFRRRRRRHIYTRIPDFKRAQTQVLTAFKEISLLIFYTQHLKRQNLFISMEINLGKTIQYRKCFMLILFLRTYNFLKQQKTSVNNHLSASVSIGQRKEHKLLHSIKSLSTRVQSLYSLFVCLYIYSFIISRDF